MNGKVRKFFCEHYTIDQTRSLKAIKNDIVEVELRLFSRHIIETVKNNSFFGSLVSEAYAGVFPDDIPFIKADIKGIKQQKKFAITKTGLFDSYSLVRQIDVETDKVYYSPGVEPSKDFSLDFLSIGIYPTYREEGSNNVKITSNDLFVALKFSGDIGTIQSAELEINDGINDSARIPSLDMPVARGTSAPELAIIHFNVTDELSFKKFNKDSKYLNVKVLLTLFNGEKKIFNISKNSNPIKPLVSSTQYLESFSMNDFRFGIRDKWLGGDDWVQPGDLTYLDEVLRKLAYDFLVTYNDFSKMNGGEHPEHSTHGTGNIFDARIDGFYRGRTSSIDERSIAKRLINILNYKDFEQKVEKIFATYTSSGQFEDEISNACLPDGRMGNDVIKYFKGHTDHFHVEYNINKEIKAQSIAPNHIKSFKGSTYGMLRFKAIPDEILKIKNLEQINEMDLKNYPFLSASDGIFVLGRAQKNDEKISAGDWIRLVSDPNDSSLFLFYKNGVEIVPVDDIKNSNLEFKILSTRKPSKGCYQTSIQSADISPYLSFVSTDGAEDVDDINFFNITKEFSLGDTFSINVKLNYAKNSDYILETNSYSLYNEIFNQTFAGKEGVGNFRMTWLPSPMGINSPGGHSYYSLQVYVFDINSEKDFGITKLIKLKNKLPQLENGYAYCMNLNDENGKPKPATWTSVSFNITDYHTEPPQVIKHDNNYYSFQKEHIDQMTYPFQIRIDEPTTDIKFSFKDAFGETTKEYLISNPCKSDQIYNETNSKIPLKVIINE